MFSLAVELKMTVRRLEQEMDAAEFMEWIAYYQTKDEKLKDELLAKIANETSIEESNAQVRAFLQALRRTK